MLAMIRNATGTRVRLMQQIRIAPFMFTDSRVLHRALCGQIQHLWSAVCGLGSMSAQAIVTISVQVSLPVDF